MVELEHFRNDDDMQTHAAGATIFQAGDPGDRMYVILEGQVEILIGQHRLDRLTAGDVFGEMGVIRQRPRSATARAETDCKIVCVDQPRFKSLIQESPQFALEVMQVMTERLRREMSLKA